jgi:hypothetical protein
MIAPDQLWILISHNSTQSYRQLSNRMSLKLNGYTSLKKTLILYQKRSLPLEPALRRTKVTEDPRLLVPRGHTATLARIKKKRPGVDYFLKASSASSGSSAKDPRQSQKWSDPEKGVFVRTPLGQICRDCIRPTSIFRKLSGPPDQGFFPPKIVWICDLGTLKQRREPWIA